MSHEHSHLELDQGKLDKRLWATAAINVIITGAEFVGGILSGSLALISDAAHNLSDVIAIIVAIVARQVGRRSATARYTYGFKRVEVLSALINALTLITVTALIAREAVLRLLHPQPIVQGTMLVLGLVALSVNVLSVFLLREHDASDVNVRGAFLHMAQDALASLAVVIAALFANTAWGPYIDATVALLVGVVILRSSISLVWKTVSTILEGVPADLDVLDLATQVGEVFAPASMHHLHVWEIGPKQRLLTAHVSLGQAMDVHEIEAIISKIKSFLNENWKINHATLEPELFDCEHNEVLGQCPQPHTDKPDTSDVVVFNVENADPAGS